MKKSWVGVLALLVSLVSGALAQEIATQRATLSGLTGFEVVVEELTLGAEQDKLTRSTLQSDVEQKLRDAGIRVLTSTERLAMPGSPYLYLRIGTVRNRVGIYGYHIALELRQLVRLTRDPSITSWAATWASGGIVGTIGADGLSSAVRDGVRDEIELFLSAYMAANPKREERRE